MILFKVIRMPCIITLTCTPTTVDNSGQVYDYTDTDRILKNINKNIYEVFYSGQNQGKNDKELLDTIEHNEIIYFYYRKKTSTPFIYLGETKIYDIIQHRKTKLGCAAKNEDRLQIHLIFKNIGLDNFKLISTFPYDMFPHTRYYETINVCIRK